MLKVQFVEHEDKLEVVSALMLSRCCGAQSPVCGAQEQVGNGECLDVVVVVLGHVGSSESSAVNVVVVLQQAGSGECLDVVVVVVVPEAQFVEHKKSGKR